MFQPVLVPLAALGFGADTAVLGIAIVLAVLGAPWLAIRAYRDTQPRVTGATHRVLVGLRLCALWTLLALLVEPVLFSSRTVEVEPSILLLVDNSASMSVASAGGTSRFDDAVRRRARIGEQIGEAHGGARLWFGEGARRMEHSSRSQEPASGPEAEGTDLRALLISATQRHLEDELAGVLLFSDGVGTTEGDRATLAGLNVPVWTIAAPDSAGPGDLALSRVRYPVRVSRGDELAVDGEVRARANAAGSTVLRLRRDGAVIDSVAVEFGVGAARIPFEFVVRVDSVGYARFELDLVPGADESVLRNNRMQVGVRVEKERLRVLQLAGIPGWDTHFLRHAIRADSRIQWDTAYRTPQGLRIAGTDSVLSWPLSREQLGEIDLFVASDAPDLALLADEGAGVLDAVRTGASLWILATNADRAPDWPAAIRAVAPIVPGRQARWIRGDVRPAMTAAGRSHPVWALSAPTGDVDAILGRVPPLAARIAPMDVSVDADVLLQAGAGRVSSPVLAVRGAQLGRVAVFNGAPLWSWSFWRLGEEGTEEFFRSMTRNLVTWLAEGGDRERIRLVVPRPVVARGEQLVLRALTLDATLRPDTRQEVWLEWATVEGDTVPAGRIRMGMDPATAGGRVAQLPALAPGEYVLRASLEENGRTLGSPWQPLTIDPFSVEFRDPRVDRVQLAALARATGGDLLEEGEVGPWIAGLDLERRQRILHGRIELGSRLWLVLPLLAFLSAEWALRKRIGLI